MLLLLPGALLAAPRVADPVAAKLSERLREAADGDRAAFRFATPVPAPPGAVTVVVEGEPDEAALADLGAVVTAQARGLTQADVPYGSLRALAALPGVRTVREPWRARPLERVTEGYAGELPLDFHAEGFTGQGVKIGIVDVGFARFDAVGDAEVPTDVTTDFSRGNSESTEHGTAVTEIVYDFAPDASYYLATFSSEVEFAEALEWMASQHVDVVNGSIGFDNKAHADGWSFPTRAVEDLVDSGAIYVAAAGNENGRYRVGGLDVQPGGGVRLAGIDGVRAVTAGGFAEVSLRWSEPFGEASTDLDLVLYNDDGSECGRSGEPQDGRGDPYEVVYATGCSDVVTARIESADGKDPFGLEGYLYAPYGLEEYDWTNTEDLTLPGDTVGGLSVGAWDAFDAQVPDYSSRGPTNDGRSKPDVVAFSGVSTATYGRGGFEGSSAAAPHVTGLAALWVDASNRHGEPELFKEWLLDHAEDVGDPGVDEASGAGLAVMDELPPTRCGCANAGEGTTGLAVLAAAFGARRRR